MTWIAATCVAAGLIVLTFAAAMHAVLWLSDRIQDRKGNHS